MHTTDSTDFPVANPFGLLRTVNSGGKDVFVTVLNPGGTAAVVSGYLGGAYDDYGYGVAVDAESSAYIVGLTFSPGFPVTGAFQSVQGGSGDGFLAKFRFFDPALTATQIGSSLQLRWPATAGEYVLQAANPLLSPLTWAVVPQAPAVGGGFRMLTLPATNQADLFRLYRPH
jgi:hypothetical protein